MDDVIYLENYFGLMSYCNLKFRSFLLTRFINLILSPRLFNRVIPYQRVELKENFAF